MPGLRVPSRRSRSSSSDAEQDTAREPSSSYSTTSSASKRRKIIVNEAGNDEDAQDTPILPHTYRSDQNGRATSRPAPEEPDELGFQPGSIMRVTLDRFVTYNYAEFKLGPSLNMVIGPNGTGKSTLVCAICLGLGWGPQHLGRAKEISEFVKHGETEASIEIELKGRPEDEIDPVIRRKIFKEGNKSSFYINGKPTSMKSVTDFCRSFSIQIDNLCQFLPQDKVCEFAALTPVELLQSTQRAAAPPYMLEWHENLKDLRAEEKKLQVLQTSEKETHTNLKSRQEALGEEVERMKERAELVRKMDMLTSARPFARYQQTRKRHEEARARKNEAKKELDKLKTEVEPSLRAVKEKEEYQKEIEKGVRARKLRFDEAGLRIEDLVKVQEDYDTKMEDCNNEIKVEADGEIARKRDEKEIALRKENLRSRIKEEPMALDITWYQDRHREKKDAQKEVESKATTEKDRIREWVTSRNELDDRIQGAKRELEDYNTQAGQRLKKLASLSPDTFKAWKWIQENQHRFEQPICGPPIVECSIKDPKYLDHIESLFRKGDLVALTLQSRNDVKTLGNILFREMELTDIYMRTSTSRIESFRPPVSEQEIQRLGFDGWAIEYITAPDPILAMLCVDLGIHRTAIALQDITDSQYPAIEASPISSFVTGRNNYQITRRREYGAGATSTRVTDVRPGNYWTEGPADPSTLQRLRGDIKGWTRECEGLETKITDSKAKLARYRQEYNILSDEAKELSTEKEVKQKALQEWKSLPDRLVALEAKHESLKQQRREVNSRVNTIRENRTEYLCKKAQVVIEHAEVAKSLQGLLEDWVFAEIFLAEATSDYKVLLDRSQDVRQQLEDRRTEVAELTEQSKQMTAQGKKEYAACQKTMSDHEEPDALKEFIANELSPNISLEDLDNLIESAEASIGLIHQENPRAIEEFAKRQEKINKLEKSLARRGDELEGLAAGIQEIRDQWEPELDGLVAEISKAFGRSFERIGCAGEISVLKDDDFDQWSIQIMVKFRESEPLTLLTAHRQSGGERAVSTIFYLMALQSLSRSPFRVVDEINQGMDPRNERMVHEQLVNIACGVDQGDGAQVSQYFLITPKLLSGLAYHPLMRVHEILSGEHMDAFQKLNIQRTIETQLRVKALA